MYFFYNFAANIACSTNKKSCSSTKTAAFFFGEIQLLNNSYNGIEKA